MDDKLNMHLLIRSNDVMLGLPHDIGGHVLLQYILAQKLKVGIGKFTHSISHAHIYLDHENQAKQLIQRKIDHKPIQFKLPPDSYKRAFAGDKKLVKEIVDQLTDQYKPQPPVEKMQIAL